MLWSEWAYLLSRGALSVLALAVSWMTVQFARTTPLLARYNRIGLTGAALLGAAALLSAYDGIDNVLLRPHEPILASSWIWFGVFDVALPIYAWLLIRTLRERNGLLLELQQLSITDPLTGALNRRGFLDRAATSIAQGHRANQSMVLVVLDLDDFKAVNDAFGHDAGDTLLKTIVQAVSQELREGDLLGRLGGDEFALLVVNSELLAAVDVVKRSLARAKNAIRQLRGGAEVDVSAGLAPVENLGHASNAAAQALATADEALYAAKRAGKSRIVTAGAIFHTLSIVGAEEH